MTKKSDNSHPVAQSLCPAPIFIIGSPRSGTSVMAWSLAQHSRMWTSMESDFVYHLFGEGRIESAYETSKEGSGIRWLKQEQVERAEFYRALGVGVNALFSSRSSGKRWVDQTPLYTIMVNTLDEMFPNAQFLHVLRDGRRVVNSMLNFLHPPEKGIGANEADQAKIGDFTIDFREACCTWRKYTQLALNYAARNPHRCLTVVNERLVANPTAEFRKIFSFLKVQQESKPAQFFSSNRINSSYRPDSQDPNWVRQLSEPWKDWTDEQRAIFIVEAGELLVQCGFVTEQDPFLKIDRELLAKARLPVPAQKVEPAGTAAEAALPAVQVLVKELSALRGAIADQAHQLTNQARLIADQSRTISELTSSWQDLRSQVQELRENPDKFAYEALIRRIRSQAEQELPADSVVLVISRGDEELIHLPGLKGWHFPQALGGVYAGYHPANCQAAIQHLEALHTLGAEFLLIPESESWWLDHYREFAQHLEANCLFVRRSKDCLIYGWRDPSATLSEHSDEEQDPSPALALRRSEAK